MKTLHKIILIILIILPTMLVLEQIIFQIIVNHTEITYFVVAIITIISLSASPFVYFIQRWYNANSERKRASDNLCRELENAFQSLDRQKFKNDALSFKTNDDREIFFMNRNFNHDFYDSLIFSGKINFLKPNLQQQVQNIFNQIKIHNKYLTLTRDVRLEKQESYPESTYPFYIWMDENEKELRKNIPIMIKRLKENF